MILKGGFTITNSKVSHDPKGLYWLVQISTAAFLMPCGWPLMEVVTEEDEVTAKPDDPAHDDNIIPAIIQFENTCFKDCS